MMYHGRNNGKKLKAIKILEHAFEIIHLLTDQNPMQVLVDAIIKGQSIPFFFIFTLVEMKFCSWPT